MARRGKRRTLAKSVYSDASGISIIARASKGKVTLTKEARYPHGTPISEMRTWQRDTIAELRKLLDSPAAKSTNTLTQDVDEYLTLKTMTAIKDRARDLR